MAERPKNLGDLGSPLLGSIHSGLSRAVKGRRSSGSEGARRLGERIQGSAASRADGAGNWLLRIFFANWGGQILPTRRATAQRIQRGQEYEATQNDLAATMLRRRAERVRGVAAGKAAWVEAARNGGRDAEQAILLLFSPESWQEFQRSFIPSGINQGKRVTEVRAWQEVLSRPENHDLWQTVQAKRPDLTPEVMQAAEEQLSHLIGEYVTYDVLGGSDRAILNELSTLGLSTVIDSLNVGTLPALHETFFTEIGRLADPALSTQLLDKLRTLKAIPAVGPMALGSFAGGPRQRAMDEALIAVGESYATI